MLEIAQTGQAGKTSLLFDMHRLRKRIFKDRMGWNVSITPGGLEVDDFDLPNAIYLLALDSGRRVIGTWRLLPTNGPTMIREIWSQFLDTIEMPSDPHVWEASRFAVDCPKIEGDEGSNLPSLATQELFCGLTELCILCGIKKIYTLYDMRIARLLKKLNCEPQAVSERLPIDGQVSQVACFVTDESMLERLRAATGMRKNLITPDMLPPLLRPHAFPDIAV